MTRHHWLPWLLATSLLGCGGSGHEDLKKFMEETGMEGQAKLEPLPPVLIADAFEYNPEGLESPFTARNLRPTKTGGGGLQPDIDRPKEPLEEYPLDALRMVGTLRQRNQTYAIIRSPEGSLHKVSRGNHIGQNFGVITSISEESGLEIKEIIQDSAGDWTESKAILSPK